MVGAFPCLTKTASMLNLMEEGAYYNIVGVYDFIIDVIKLPT